jgi:hypothetical protein
VAIAVARSSQVALLTRLTQNTNADTIVINAAIDPVDLARSFMISNVNRLAAKNAIAIARLIICVMILFVPVVVGLLVLPKIENQNPAALILKTWGSCFACPSKIQSLANNTNFFARLITYLELVNIATGTAKIRKSAIIDHRVGRYLDRDHNAARNILSRGLATVGHTGSFEFNSSNAWEDKTSTLVGENQLGQVRSLNQESPSL